MTDLCHCGHEFDQHMGNSPNPCGAIIMPKGVGGQGIFGCSCEAFESPLEFINDEYTYEDSVQLFWEEFNDKG